MKKMKKMNKTKTKEKLPKGYKMLNKFRTYPPGTYAVIATKGRKLIIFMFNGIDGTPTQFNEYEIIK